MLILGTMGWTSDLRRAARSLLRTPDFTLVAVATLALGLGAATALFVVVDAVLLRPLPFPQARQLVSIGAFAPGAPGPGKGGELGLSASMAQVYAERNRSFSAFGIWSVFSDVVSGAGLPPERARTFAVTPGLLQALAVPPRAGRWLEPGDEQPRAQPTALLAYGFWQRRLGGDPAAVGRMLSVNGAPRLIVGVMPRGFAIPGGLEPDLLLPLQFDPAALALGDFDFTGIARLRAGVSRNAAAADLARLLPLWLDAYPASRDADASTVRRWRLAPVVRPLRDLVVGDAGTKLWAALAAGGLLLLIACANALNLFFVRADTRRHEMAIRAALGASGPRAARGLVLEGLLVALAAAAVGLLFAQAGIMLLQRLAPAGLPRLDEIHLGAAGGLFAFALALTAAAAISLVPALHSARARLGAAHSATASRGSQRARASAVVAQVALALLLVLGAGLLIRSVAALRAVPPGFSNPATLQTFRLTVPDAMATSPGALDRLKQNIIETISALPGVRSAAFASGMPMQGYGGDWAPAMAQSRPELSGPRAPARFFVQVSPGFFQTSGTPLIAGREFTWPDLQQHRPVALVSASLARQWWGSAPAALGQQVRRASDPGWDEVIGVVADVHYNRVDEPAPPTIYEPAIGLHAATVAVRTPRAGTESFLAHLRMAVAAASGGLPVYSAATMETIYANTVALPSFLMLLMALTAALALALGLVGIYAVVAGVVGERRREIAIRMALGADAAQVRRMILAGGLRLGIFGAAGGLAAAVLLARLLQSLLFEVSPFDPATFFAATAALLAAVAAASYLPARRAAAVAPAEALSSE